jgi:hypothetical protein
MDKRNYTCRNCGLEFKPRRRFVQKYCSNSCRARAFVLRNEKLGSTVPSVEKKSEPVKIEKMSLSGVANAAAGVAAVKLIESILTSDENKHATKKDIRELKELFINRYIPILNVPPNNLGEHPFVDLQLKLLVYLKKR